MVSVVLRSCVGEKGVACDAFCVVLGGEGAAPPSAAAGTVAIKYAVLQDKEAWTGELSSSQVQKWLTSYQRIAGRGIEGLVEMLSCRVKGVAPQSLGLSAVVLTKGLQVDLGKQVMIWRDSAGGGSSLNFPVQLVPSADPANTARDALGAVATTVGGVAERVARHIAVRDSLRAETELLTTALGRAKASEADDREDMLDEMCRRLNTEKSKIRRELVRLGRGDPEWDESYDAKTDDEDDGSSTDDGHDADPDEIRDESDERGRGKAGPASQSTPPRTKRPASPGPAASSQSSQSPASGKPAKRARAMAPLKKGNGKGKAAAPVAKARAKPPPEDSDEDEWL